MHVITARQTTHYSFKRDRQNPRKHHPCLKDTCQVHLSQDLKPRSSPHQAREAVDFGYTEVIADTQGNHYGPNLENYLTML